MRVAYVCTDPGIPVFGTKGASLHVRAVLAELRRRGCEVHLISPRAGGYQDAGLRVHDLPKVTGERGAQDSDAAVGPRLDRLHAERPFDLVYERYALWGRTATAWAAAQGVPSILEVNAPLPSEAARYRSLQNVSQATEVAREAFSAAGTVICVSEPVRAWAASLAADPARVHVVENGVDTSRIQPGRRSAGEHFTLGFVGTLKPWHGVEVLLQALALLLERDPSYRLLVVGDGPEGERLRRLGKGLGERVEFTGAVSDPEIPALLQRMDVACAPYPDGEDFYFSPLKVYEYLAAGLPVIASRVGGLPNLLQNGRLGVLVRPGDPAEIASAVAELRVDVDRRAALRTAARQAALGHDWSHVVDRIAELAGVTHFLGKAHA